MATEQYRSAWSAYQESIAAMYQRDVRSLIEAPEPTEVELPEDEPVERALESSEQLAEAIGERLDSSDPAERQLAVLQLSAGASVDIGVAADLIRRSDEFGPQGIGSEGEPVESLSFNLPEAASVLDAEDLAQVPDGAGGPPRPGSPSAEGLENEIEKTIGSIRTQAGKSGGAAVEGLVASAVPIGEALGVVAKGLLGGLAEGLSFLIRKAIGFVVKAIQKLLRLLGTKVTEAISDKLADWLKDLEKGEGLESILTRLWDTSRIEEETKKQVTTAGERLTEERAKEAVKRLEDLSSKYGKQAELIRKVLKGVKFIAPAAAALAPPAGGLIVAGGYSAVLVFLALAGADYVDWYRVEKDGAFDRVDGVRHVIGEAVA